MSAASTFERVLKPVELPSERPLLDDLPVGVVELSGGVGPRARFTFAVSLVIRAQARGEPVAWVQFEDGSLFPPDLSEAGVDLSSLVIVQVPKRSPSFELARAAELLLRSGAFGLVAVDLTSGLPSGDAWLGRIASLARQHASRVALLTSSDSSSASAGPLVALRLEPRREHRGFGRYAIRPDIVKDKRGLSTRVMTPTAARGPWGLG
jgi:recombination protein RecA